MRYELILGFKEIYPKESIICWCGVGCQWSSAMWGEKRVLNNTFIILLYFILTCKELTTQLFWKYCDENNCLCLRKFIPPLNIPTASENITLLIILPFQDPCNLIFFKEMEQRREFSAVRINFEHTCKICERILQGNWEYFNSRAKLSPPVDEPKGQVRIEILIKINKPWMRHVFILMKHESELGCEIIMIWIRDRGGWKPSYGGKVGASHFFRNNMI